MSKHYFKMKQDDLATFVFSGKGAENLGQKGDESS
jgi:hypothetical protein